jgi:copper chaperone CopZ
MTEAEFRIQGMSCEHCVRAVRQSLEHIPGVEVDEVVLGAARVRYDETTIPEGRIRAAIEETGYRVLS